MARSEESAAPSDGRLVGSDRVLALLIELARRPDGASLDDLAVAFDSAKSTVHRALGSLTRSGLATRAMMSRQLRRLRRRPHVARYAPIGSARRLPAGAFWSGR